MSLTTFIAELEELDKKGDIYIDRGYYADFYTLPKLLACVKVLAKMVEKASDRAWCSCYPCDVAHEARETLSKCESIIAGEGK